MKAQEFIETYKTQFSEYCPCIITAAGDVIECADAYKSAGRIVSHGISGGGTAVRRHADAVSDRPDQNGRC